MKKWLMAALLMLTLAACIRDGKYEVQGDVVVYSYWTFSFGPRSDTLPDADAATFRSVTNWLAHDSSRVYFKSNLVPGADATALHAVRYPLFHDGRDYYYHEEPLHVTDVESFKVIKWMEDDFWAKDSRYAYYNSQRMDDVDLSTFKVVDWSWARDKNHVYYYGELIQDADPATFEVMGHSIYCRDKSHIWCGNTLMEDVDRATFKVDDIDRAHDKNGRYWFEKRDTVEVE